MHLQTWNVSEAARTVTNTVDSYGIKVHAVEHPIRADDYLANI
jgi:hypothetical protein